MKPGTAVMAPDDDAALASRIAQRDEHAFETLMRRHNRLLYRVARSILKDDAEAEDAVQEAYLAAYRNIAGFRGGAKLSTWLARIVMNEAYARLRKRKRAVVVSLESDRLGTSRETPSLEEEEAMAEDKAERPEAAAMRAELR